MIILGSLESAYGTSY